MNPKGFSQMKEASATIYQAHPPAPDRTKSMVGEIPLPLPTARAAAPV